MTMPKFESVAEVLWYDPDLRMTPESAGKIIDSSIAFIESAAIGTTLHPADQLTEAYEAGKRDAIPEWRPIETAPKVGTFLVYMPTDSLQQIQIAKWHPNIKVIGNVFAFDAKPPTHWMPLPAAPKGEE